MCVIVYKPKDIPVDLDLLKMCWDKNEDGAGVMFPVDGGLNVAKGFLKWKSFKRYLKRRGLDSLGPIPIAFHFRIATHGTVSSDNTHPFLINDELAMMHNGVINKVNKYIGHDENITDSEAFARRFVRDPFSSITITCLKSGQPINELYAEYIGSGNKLLFMDKYGDVAIINESAGTWISEGVGSGMWFSNTFWKPQELRARTITSYENGRSVTKSYDKDGKLISTSINAGYGSGYGSRYGCGGGYGSFSLDRDDSPWLDIRNLESISNRYPKIDDSAEWYCYDCADFFYLSESKRTYWTNGLKERIVDCPMCGEANTCEAEDALNDVLDDEIVTCFTCDNESFSVDLETEHVDGEMRYVCSACGSNKTYKEDEKNHVLMFGADYFDAPIAEGRNGDSRKELRHP